MGSSRNEEEALRHDPIKAVKETILDPLQTPIFLYKILYFFHGFGPDFSVLYFSLLLAYVKRIWKERTERDRIIILGPVIVYL